MGYLTSGDESKDSRVRGHSVIAGLQDGQEWGARAILPVTLTLLFLCSLHHWGTFIPSFITEFVFSVPSAVRILNFPFCQFWIHTLPRNCPQYLFWQLIPVYLWFNYFFGFLLSFESRFFSYPALCDLVPTPCSLSFIQRCYCLDCQLSCGALGWTLTRPRY